MKYVMQFLIIVAFSFAGELLHFLLPLPIPASIYGIVLLFAALEMKLLRVQHIKETSTFLIAVMPLMFVPPAVGLIPSWEGIKTHLGAYAIITIASTFIVMAVAGWVTQLMIKRKG